MTGTVGVLGGTGEQGRGLALRLGLAGTHVLLGSRDADRAKQAASGLATSARGASIEGLSNADVARRADLVIVAVPYDGLRALVEGVAGDLDGKIVVSCVNPLDFSGGPHALAVPEGSAAEQIADAAPQARVVGAFHTVSAPKLLDAESPVHGDVPVCGDDDAACDEVVGLVDMIDNLRGVRCGPLYHAGTLEALTALLISVNKRYKTSAGVKFTNIDD